MPCVFFYLFFPQELWIKDIPRQKKERSLDIRAFPYAYPQPEAYSETLPELCCPSSQKGCQSIK